MSALQDRQIKPIYDALETGSYKAALQTCNKLLKKQPNFEIVKALKALTLARAGKTEESSPICDEILIKRPTEEGILAALSHALRALGRHEDVTAMYDEAYKKQAGNEELGAQTFMANTKVSNWKAAQQIATKMHKLFKDDRYLYWSIMAAVLQANDPHTPAPSRSMLFGLSLRLIETASTPSFVTPDRFYLHLSILFEMGRLREAHTLLSSPAGQHLCATSLVVDEVRSQVAVKRNLWKAEGEHAKLRLEGAQATQQPEEVHPDQQEEAEETRRDRNWLTFLAYLDSVFRKQSEFSLKATIPELDRIRDPKEVTREKQLEEEDKMERERMRAKLGEKEEQEEAEVVETSIEERVQMARNFLEKLADSDGIEERGSLLALLELERRIRDESEMQSVEGVYVRLLARYLRTFGAKQSCYEDLRPYVMSLKDREIEQWKIILNDIPVDTSNEPNLRRLINRLKLYRICLTAGEVTMESETQALQEFVKLYHEALPLGRSLPKTDMQFADDLAVLSGEVLVSLWKLSGDISYVSTAAIFLEYALTHSKHNYQFRIMLIRLYRLLAAPGPALDHYRTLNPRQMQTDTLSHLILSRAATFSLASIGDLTMPNECMEASQIYSSNSTETAEMIARAFQHEKYSQVQDFILFEDRLDNSLQRDLTKIEHVRMRLTHEPALPETIDAELLEFRFIFDRIHHDNRDFTILPNHQPRSQSFDFQTVIGGVHPAFGWLEVWLKIYIRALTQASDYDENVKNKTVDPLYLRLIPHIEDPRPLQERVGYVSEGEMQELTQDEKSFWEYTTALAQWLEPYHAASRPKINSNGSTASSDVTSSQPVWSDPPEIVKNYYEGIIARLDELSDDKHLPCEALHVAQLAQEAFVLFSTQTTRFRSLNPRKKGDMSPQAIKTLRFNSVTSLKTIADKLARFGEVQSSADTRKYMASSAERLIAELEHNFSYEIAKKIADARKRILDGMAKGILKISSTR